MINLCDDPVVLDSLSSDPTLVEYIGNSILDISQPHADLLCMLLANLAKKDTIVSIFDCKRKALNPKLSTVADSSSTEGANKEEVAALKRSLNR